MHRERLTWIQPVALAALGTVWLLLAASPTHPQESDDTDRGWLGLYIRNVDRQDIEALKLPRDTRGVVVSGVDDDGPAALAGIEPGDVIVRLDGQAVVDRPEFLEALGNRRVGDRLRLSVVRGGVTRLVEFRLHSRPREMQGSAAIDPGTMGHVGGDRVDPSSWNLKTFDLVDADLARYFRVEPGGGVLILQVHEALLREKLRPGDVVVACEGQPVATTTQLRQEWQQHGDTGSINLRIIRNRRSRLIAVAVSSALPTTLSPPRPAPIDNVWTLEQAEWQELRRQVLELRRGLQQLQEQAGASHQKR